MSAAQFIPDQQLYTLQLNSRQREITRQYLTQNCLPDQHDAARELTDHTPAAAAKQSQWAPVPDRLQYLIDAGTRPAEHNTARGQRLCITALAGGGKSKCLEQLVFVRAQCCPGHVVAHFHISELPASSSAWGNSLLLHIQYWLQLAASDPARATAPAPTAAELKRWISDLADCGKLTLAIDGLDEIAVTDGRVKMQALREYLDCHPRIHCVVAGRPYAIYEDYWWLLLARSPESEASDWQFCIAEVFNQEQRERFLGLAILQKLARLQAGLELNPRTLEVLRTLDETTLASVNTLADIYWHSNYKAVCLDRKQNQQLCQTKLRPQQILSILGAVAFQSIVGVPPEAPGRFFDDSDAEPDAENAANPVTSDEQPQAATTLPLTETVWDALRPRIAAACNEQELSREEASGLLDELHKLGSQYIEFAYITLQEKDLLKWRVATQRDFLAALYLLRHGSIADINWLKARQSRVLTYRSEQSQYPELLELWRFVCGMPDEALDKFKESSERWAALMQALYKRPDSRPRATELMALALPRLLQRAEILTNAAWTQQNLQHAIEQAQATASVTPPKSNMCRRIVNEFLSDYPKLRAGDQRQLCQEDLEQHWKHCDSAAKRAFRAGHAVESDNQPQLRTLEAAFELCAIPVTQRLYALFDPGHAALFADYQQYSPRPRCPAVYLNFWDAWMLSIWLHARLPNEWEWEYAARGPQDLSAEKQPIWWWGDEESQLPDHAWVDENTGGEATREVGTRKPNPYGLFDMLGNVWEWTDSMYDSEDPNRVGRVLRGGSFLCDAILARCSARFGYAPSASRHSCGCRLARAAIR
ncbi:MAG: formylglycine-generating enzyme family protein, partial [Planctomycetaceae bacterium]